MMMKPCSMHVWLGDFTPKLQTQRLHIGLQLSPKHSFQDKPKFYPKILHKCLLSSSPFVILGLLSRNSPVILKFMNKNMTHVPLISCVHFIIQAQSYCLEETVILEIKEHDVYVTLLCFISIECQLLMQNMLLMFDDYHRS